MKSLTDRLEHRKIRAVAVQAVVSLFAVMFYLSYWLPQHWFPGQTAEDSMGPLLANTSLPILADIFLRQTLVAIAGALLIATIIQ